LAGLKGRGLGSWRVVKAGTIDAVTGVSGIGAAARRSVANVARAAPAEALTKNYVVCKGACSVLRYKV